MAQEININSLVQTLASYGVPTAQIAQVRELGRNLHLQRFGALRGRGWHARLQAALAETQAAPASGGALSLTFEVIYGHAVRAPTRHAVSSQTAIQLGDMRAALRRRGQNPHGV